MTAAGRRAQASPLAAESVMTYLLIFLLFLFTGCGGNGSPAAPSTPVPSPTPAPRQVVIVSIDGLRPDAVFKADASNIKALAARGAFTWEARTIMPSNTLPSHVSMLTAYPPEMHRMTWDDYLPARGRLSVPTVFTAARAAGLRTAMVVGKSKFDYFRDTGAVDSYFVSQGGDDAVAGQALVQAQSGFNLMFVHFPDVDLSGHAGSWMSSSYMDHVVHADQAVGRLLAALPPSTTVILTSDHGGGSRANNHGSDAACDMTIPWVVSGPRTLRGYRLSTAVSTTDTAATAAWVLGLSLPADVAGQPVLEAFLPGR